MRLEAMHYFLEIADLKSISKVSRKYKIPQQNLSSMLAALESELNTELFVRFRKNLTLTEAGNEFYQFCSNFFIEYKKIKGRLHPLVDKPKKVIDVVVQNHVMQTVVPNWISFLLKYRPEIELNVEIKTAIEIVDDILLGHKEIGLLSCYEKDDYRYPEISEELSFIPLFVTEPYFWVSAKNPLFQKNSLTMEEVNTCKLIQDDKIDINLKNCIEVRYATMAKDTIFTKNIRIMLQLVRDNIAICPDLKVEQGELGMSYLFAGDEDIKAIPLSKKDNYKLVTGYMMRKIVKESGSLNEILEYLEQ